MRTLKSILLTGGAGFIGSHLAESLLARPDLSQLVILDALTYAGKKENLQNALSDPRCHFIHGNILDRELVASLFQKYHFSGVFNLAAESHVDRSISDARVFTLSNILGTSDLLDHARRHRIPLLQCSTDEVYGPTPFPEKFTENTALQPSSPYAASKAAADHLCLAAHRTHGQDLVIARPTNNYGSRQFPEKLIPRFIHLAMRDQALPLYGSGSQIRDWIHVRDCAEGLIAAFLKGKSGRCYHLGAEYERSNLGLARLILKQLGKPESLIAHIADRPGHDVRYALDTRLAKQQLLWQAKRPFQIAFKETVREIAAYEALNLPFKTSPSAKK